MLINSQSEPPAVPMRGIHLVIVRLSHQVTAIANRGDIFQMFWNFVHLLNDPLGLATSKRALPDILPSLKRASPALEFADLRILDNLPLTISLINKAKRKCAPLP